MIAKEYLTKFALTDPNIKECQNEIEHWQQYTAMKRPALTNEETKSKINKRVATLEDRIKELETFKIKVTSEIEAMDDSKLKDVLVKRYIEKKKWAKVAEELFHDVTYIHKLHRKGLKEFSERSC